MNQILDIVVPVFGLIAIGYAIAWTRLLPAETGEHLADFVFAVAIPVLIFRTIAAADFSGASPWLIWLPFFGVFGLMWIVGAVLVRKLFGRDARAGLVAGVSAAYGNTVLVGIPLTLAAFGEAGAVAIALIVAVHLPVTMAASAILIERAERQDGVAGADADARAKAKAVVFSLVRNPIIVGIVIGGLWRLLGLSLGGVPGILVDRIAEVAATIALLALGMSLRKYGLRGNVSAGLVLCGLKLVVMPAIVLVLVRYVVPMPPLWAKVVVVAAACPTGVNAYLVAARFKTGEGLASNAITISTAFAVVTITVWLSIVQAL